MGARRLWWIPALREGGTVTLGSWLAAVTGSYQAALMHFPVSTGCVGAASASQPF